MYDLQMGPLARSIAWTVSTESVMDIRVIDDDISRFKFGTSSHDKRWSC